MAADIKPDFYCSVCNAPVTQADIDSGAAVVRFEQVLCLKHFNELYPEECISHPGEKVTAKCSHCGRWACDNCFIELEDKKVCVHCKPALIAGFFTGQPPPEPRKRFRPLKASREVASRLFTKRHEWRERVGKDTDRLEGCIISCFTISFLVIIGLIILILFLQGC